MSTDSVHLERRAAQRFDFHLPVCVRLAGSDQEGHGFTQDLSARGALFYTDFALNEGDAIELTLVMPSEITLAENMRVRCRGKVVRVAKPAVGSRTGVAVHLEGYEFLPDADTTNESATSFGRISALHQHRSEEPEAVEPPAVPRPTLVP
ncbi:MAG: PilZ domain-containing protein [Acidobacteriia bacterium]|nr:PilZ domain-containing protein [Terriglobia bacterium]